MLRLVQRAGQRAFLAAEGVFNRVFGDALNPFYYLGAIAYFLLWIVVGSGLYLYVFFDTGVHEAYDSVERLTHGQWWLGGIMRSFHRYASDAMVLAMVLHLVRHFVFDHYRSFRWFSWMLGRDPAVARLRLGHQRLHAAVGPHRAVRHDRHGRVARLAARVQRAR